MSQPRYYRDYLEDICQAARKALHFVEGAAYEDLPPLLAMMERVIDETPP